jgi:CDP-glycerol glycerophosphotransferase
MRAAMVVPVGSDHTLLGGCLAAIREQDHPVEQVILVDDSPNGTLQPIDGTTLLRSGGRGPYAARNLGWRATDADIVLFLDLRSRPHPGWARRLLELFEDPAVAFAGSDTTIRSGQRLAERISSRHQFFRVHWYVNEGVFWPYFPTCNLALRRSDLEAAGGFVETRSGADANLCWRILEREGRRHATDPDVLMEWVPRATVRGYLQQNYRYGRSIRALRAAWESAGAPQIEPRRRTRLMRKAVYISARMALSRVLRHDDQVVAWLRHLGRVAFQAGFRRTPDPAIGFGPLQDEGLAPAAGSLRPRPAGALLSRSTLHNAGRQALRPYYRTRRRRPLDPDLALFTAYWDRGYLCNPRAIYERATDLVPGLRGVWVVRRAGRADLPPGIEYVLAESPAYYDAVARASVLVSNVNLPDDVVKRAGAIHVMTHHGTPLKYMGLDLRDKPKQVQHPDFGALLRRCARWDFSVSSNSHSTEVWRRAYRTRAESLEIGYPRNDALVNASAEEVARLRSAFGIRPDQKAVLYAPTFRDAEDGYVARLDLAGVVRALPQDWVMLARLHHRYTRDEALVSLQAEGRIVDASRHPLPSDVMLAADVLVTDYSSIMFDYAILDRPIVIHAPDWEQYSTERGVYFDLLAEAPGAVTRTDAELIAALNDGKPFDGDHARQRAAFRQRFCALERGTAAEQVVRRVWGDRAA